MGNVGKTVGSRAPRNDRQKYPRIVCFLYHRYPKIDIVPEPAKTLFMWLRRVDCVVIETIGIGIHDCSATQKTELHLLVVCSKGFVINKISLHCFDTWNVFSKVFRESVKTTLVARSLSLPLQSQFPMLFAFAHPLRHNSTLSGGDSRNYSNRFVLR